MNDELEPGTMIDCHHCHGDGMDPDNDYLLPCPRCDGEGFSLAREDEDCDDD